MVGYEGNDASNGARDAPSLHLKYCWRHGLPSYSPHHSRPARPSQLQQRRSCGVRNLAVGMAARHAGGSRSCGGSVCDLCKGLVGVPMCTMSYSCCWPHSDVCAMSRCAACFSLLRTLSRLGTVCRDHAPNPAKPHIAGGRSQMS
jgi:hypothetical protein